jgi:adhesin transport system membrane fusion protein
MNRRFQVNQTGYISMTLLLLIGLVLFLLWAALFEIDETVRAQGQVIPSSRTQIIQAADGGVLSELLVQEGQSVSPGQRIAILEKDRSNAAFEESRSKVGALHAALMRTKAEASNTPLEFGEEFKEFPEFVAAQQALYTQRLRSLNEELKTLREGLNMAQEELRMNESLYKTGDIGQIEVMRAKRGVSELQGKINAVRNKYQQEARAEAIKLEEELSSNRYKLEGQQSVLGHTELTTPVAGIVKYLKINTIGGVLRAGDELMQISPTEGEMVIEVKINPVDIGHLTQNLPAAIKLDAFDYSIYGTVDGILTYISSDTLVEQSASDQTISYYRAHIKLNADQLKANSKLAGVPLKPGMTATVDIRTNRRSVLQYLAKPIFKAFGGAMNER